jgi:cell division septation protein DedD
VNSSVKERLTGALILIVAVVIVVPELFSGRPPPRPTTEAPDAQAADAGPPLRSYTLELGAAPAAQADTEPATVTEVPAETAPAPASVPASTPTASPAAAQSPAPVLPEPTLPATKPPVAKAPVVTPAAKPTVTGPTVATATTAHGWWVQLGSFSARANADRLAGTLGSAGYSVRVSPTTKNGKELYRVLAGPADDRAAAVALQARLAAAGHKGSSLVAP